jgi:lantibiotic biosynthesis protein
MSFHMSASNPEPSLAIDSPSAEVPAWAWRPLLQGSLASRAREAIAGLAAELDSSPFEPVGLEAKFPHSLAFGDCGIALFYAYLADTHVEHGNGGAFRDRAIKRVERAFRALEDVRMVPDLFRGFAGVAWTYGHLETRLWPDQQTGEDPCVEIDEMLCRWCEIPTVSVDLLQGVAGICLYAAQRPTAPSAQRLRDIAVTRLRTCADVLPNGRAWRAPAWIAELLTHEEGLGTRDEIERIVQHGIYKIGAAHGAAGILAGMSIALPRSTDQAAARRVSEDVLEWIWRQRLSDEGPSIFPEFVGVDVRQSTTGWCNGDVGVALALFTASRAMHWPEAEARALDIARRAARQRIEDIEFFNRGNPTLCHGSAGRGHLFNRLYQQTNDASFGEAAIYWFEHALSLRTPGQGTSGFTVDEPLDGGRKNIRGFLMGAAGLGLALLAATTDQEPSWDQLLVASLPH